jgi:hypothetical protein
VDPLQDWPSLKQQAAMEPWVLISQETAEPPQHCAAEVHPKPVPRQQTPVVPVVMLQLPSQQSLLVVQVEESGSQQWLAVQGRPLQQSVAAEQVAPPDPQCSHTPWLQMLEQQSLEPLQLVPSFWQAPQLPA